MKTIVNSVTCMALAAGLFFSGCQKEATPLPSSLESASSLEAAAGKSFPNAVVPQGKYYLYSISEAKYFQTANDISESGEIVDGRLTDTPQKNLSKFKVILVTDSTGYIQSLVKSEEDSSIAKAALQKVFSFASYRTIGFAIPSAFSYDPILFKFRKTATNHIEILYADKEGWLKNYAVKISLSPTPDIAELKLLTYQKNEPAYSWDFVPVK